MFCIFIYFDIIFFQSGQALRPDLLATVAPKQQLSCRAAWLASCVTEHQGVTYWLQNTAQGLAIPSLPHPWSTTATFPHQNVSFL